MTPPPRIVLGPRRAKPFFAQHPWVYPGAIAQVEGDPQNGDVVDLVAHGGRFIAKGLYNAQSKIRVRLYRWDEGPLDRDFFKSRLEAALHLRRNILHVSGPERACRLVFSEADGLSGLVVDQYDRWLIAQFTSLGLAQRKDTIADVLEELLRPEGIGLRTERGIGQLEGLDIHDGVLRGALPDGPIVIREGAISFQVNLKEGQKTGFYVDQRDNRQAVAALAAGRKMLDLFCYSGGFALHAARAGAASVLGVDVSEPALELARANAAANGLSTVQFEKSDVFDKLDALVEAGERFGVIVLDPPKFARAGNAVEEAMRGYRRLQSQALKILDADGILVVCCCSGLIFREQLHDLLAQLAAEVRRPIQILESRGASADHPVMATCPETNYLKCVVCRVG